MDWNKLLSDKRLRNTTRSQSNLDQRNEFESDFGRIIFSPALRRMHDKTQVFPLINDDNTHTRLTHSLEVATLAKSLGINLCANPKFTERINHRDKDKLVRIIPEILSSISLCHDIGNPPFGHFGEEVIAKYFEGYFNNMKITKGIEVVTKDQEGDFTKFNGNAQGFRVLTRQQILQDKFGLNLTFGTLSSFLKYPNLSTEIVQNGYRRKLGVYQSEKEILNKIREETGLINVRHPLAFLMEAADTISYQLMDIEDGFNRGLYRINDIYDFVEKNGNKSVVELFMNMREKEYNRLDLFNKDRTAIVKFRIHLIQIQINHALTKFLENLDRIESGEYMDELVYDDEKGGIAETLYSFIKDRIFTHREIQSLELTGCSVIRGLFGHFVPEIIERPKDERTKRLWSMISQSLRWLVELETGKKELHSIDNYYKLRIIVDFVSGMTDKFALSLYQKLEGIKIN